MRKLIVFLHGLNGDAETWGSLPDLVTSHLGGDYVSYCPEYHASPFSPADHDRSADQVLTTLLAPAHGEISSKLANSDLIFFVGYSDGGLIAREICKKLLLDPTKDALTNKIVAVITVGTPLEGVPLRAGLTEALSLYGQLPFKVTEIFKRPIVSDGYQSVIDLAKRRDVKRPSYFHIQIEADRLVAPHVQDNFTEDDHAAGMISGGHRDFIATVQKVRILTNKLIELIPRQTG